MTATHKFPMPTVSFDLTSSAVRARADLAVELGQQLQDLQRALLGPHNLGERLLERGLVGADRPVQDLAGQGP